jgi:hypothetical protein
MGQLTLFPSIWPVSSETRSISPCVVCGVRCGIVGEGSGPHWRSLRCVHGHFRLLVAAAEVNVTPP